MSFADLLINTCTFYRFTEGVADSYGVKVKTWTAIPTYTNIDCRHVSGKGMEIKVGAEVVLVYDQLFVNDIDVTEQDRVEIDSVMYNILSVMFRQDFIGGHHKHLYLEAVR